MDLDNAPQILDVVQDTPSSLVADANTSTRLKRKKKKNNKNKKNGTMMKSRTGSTAKAAREYAEKIEKEKEEEGDNEITSSNGSEKRPFSVMSTESEVISARMQDIRERKRRRVQLTVNESTSNASSLHQSSGTNKKFGTYHESDRSIVPEGGFDQGATVEVAPKLQQSIGNPTMTVRDGKEIYTGLKNYDTVKNRRKPNKFAGIGPQRAPDNVKINCRFDYQPDVCKDWKETGFCGYGQSCKFLHDRGDYKFGWQLDREWQKAQEKLMKKREGYDVSDDESDYEIHSDSDIEENGVPFACYICREPFTNPVVTNCGHFFCEKCAFDRFPQTSQCAVCSQDTEGSFSDATKVLERKRRAAQRKKRKKMAL